MSSVVLETHFFVVMKMLVLIESGIGSFCGFLSTSAPISGVHPLKYSHDNNNTYTSESYVGALQPHDGTYRLAIVVLFRFVNT